MLPQKAFAFSVVALALALAGGPGGASAAGAGDAGDGPSLRRAGSVINAFQVLCTLELPRFDALAAKATAMRMQLQSDHTTPGDAGTSVRRKTWTGGLTTGPFTFMVDEMSGAPGTATGCAVVAEVPDADAFRIEAMDTLKLPVMKVPELGPDGSRSYIWDGVYGPGTLLILRDFKPSGKPGAMLKLQSMKRR